jgi:DNA-binding response OmpR family regulator
MIQPPAGSNSITVSYSQHVSYTCQIEQGPTIRTALARIGTAPNAEVRRPSAAKVDRVELLTPTDGARADHAIAVWRDGERVPALVFEAKSLASPAGVDWRIWRVWVPSDPGPLGGVSLEDAPIDGRERAVLERAEIRTVGELVIRGPAMILQLTRMGKGTVSLLQDWLSGLGFTWVEPCGFADASDVFNGAQVLLSPTELKLLSALARHPGMVVGRTELIGTLWGDVEHLSRELTAQRYRRLIAVVHRLRRKLGTDGQRIEGARSHGYRLNDPTAPAGWFVYDGLTIEPGSRRVYRLPEGDGNDPVDCRLTNSEFRLLLLLAVQPGRVTRLALTVSLWDSVDSNDRRLDLFVRSLRSKLGPYGSWIITHSGEGYEFDPHRPTVRDSAPG